eukprot:626857-Rhodomonas_salina.1
MRSRDGVRRCVGCCAGSWNCYTSSWNCCTSSWNRPFSSGLECTACATVTAVVCIDVAVETGASGGSECQDMSVSDSTRGLRGRKIGV